MTLEEYKNLVNGKQIEAGGGGAGTLYQCVDLANDYIEKVYGLPKILWTDAKDFIDKGVASGLYEKSTGQAGDIAVWNWPPYGHIAIYLGNGQYLTQNYPTPLKTTIATLGTNGLVGYMRKKGVQMGVEVTEANVNGWNEAAYEIFNWDGNHPNNILTRLDRLENRPAGGQLTQAELDKLRRILNLFK